MHEQTNIITEETAGQILAAIYGKAMNGIPKVAKSVEELAEDYLARTDSPHEAAKRLAAMHIAKCGATGFFTGLGGAVTLPVAIPADLGTVLCMQMRMVSAIAIIGGHDAQSDQVQTMVYLCLLGNAINDVAKEAGIKIGKIAAENAIRKIPGSALAKVNRAVGFRLFTKFGETGVVNLGKTIPLAGGLVGGGFDAVATTAIAFNAMKVFLGGSGSTEDSEAIVVEAA